MTKEGKASLSRRLARIEGQVTGLRRMVDEDRYCIEVLTQVSAIRSALDRAAAELVASHIESCIVGSPCHPAHPAARAMSQEELLVELKSVLSRLA